MTKRTPVHVFYSWQSDSPKRTNLNAIRTALSQACKRLEAEHSTTKLVPDEATRDTSGSPNIALKILEKIEAAAVFVADVTTVTPPGAARPCPNPNVGFELGYAVAMLGWERIILLFNEEHGSFPGDLPFDFVQNRASSYRLAETDTKEKRAELASFLQTAISAVLAKNPKRPVELKGLTREKIEHDHDVENMTWLMESLHLPTLDQHILDLPYMISDRAIWFFENFRGVVANSLFNVYDPALREAVNTLFAAWSRALAHDNQYHDTPSGKIHVFSNPGDMPLPADRQAAWDDIDGARREMMQAVATILQRLRESYLEINIHRTNAKAWKDHVGFERDLDDELARKPKQKRRKKRKPAK